MRILILIELFEFSIEFWLTVRGTGLNLLETLRAQGRRHLRFFLGMNGGKTV